jgi:fluoroquinolone transport system permease protein
MQLTRVLNTLGRTDVRLIGRDTFLTGLFGYIIVISIFLRFALPWLADAVAANPEMAVHVPDYYPLIIGYMVIYLGNLIGGMVIGFVVLDERDNNTIKAMLVTPLPLSAYMLYRVIGPAVVSFAIIMIELLIINVALVPVGQLAVLAAGASLTAPLIMLFFATFAQNKVQGFALNKIVGIAGLTILAAWFVQEPLQYLLGLFPAYWFVKAYWVAHAGGSDWPLLLLIGVVYTVTLLFLMLRRFRSVAYQ